MEIQFSFKGKTITTTLPLPPGTITAHDLYGAAYNLLGVNNEETTLKLLYKGKRLQHDEGHEHDLVFGKGDDGAMADAASNREDRGSSSSSSSKKGKKKRVPKFLVMATQRTDVRDLQSKRSDPTIRGFESPSSSSSSRPAAGVADAVLADGYWGTSSRLRSSMQHRLYRFCRFEPCTWRSFGSRPSDSTPHAFEARVLLERLATDPGVRAVLIERELVVGTLGEMDPIDDRYMREREAHGGRLLGYNTNRGARIDLRLRTDDLAGFREYHEIVTTLIHELSHNWVGEHDYLFWTNFGQMLVEYMYAHLQPFVVGMRTARGQTTAERALLPEPFSNATAASSSSSSSRAAAAAKGAAAGHQQIVPYVLSVLRRDMAQHGLQPEIIAHAIQQRYDELREHGFAKRGEGGKATKHGGGNADDGDGMTIDGGYVLGAGDANGACDANAATTGAPSGPRERALRAAEERARQQRQRRKQQPETKQQEDEKLSSGHDEDK